MIFTQFGDAQCLNAANHNVGMDVRFCERATVIGDVVVSTVDARKAFTVQAMT